MKTTMNTLEYIEDNTLRLEVSRRGGGIEIDASEYLELPGAKLTAYQNYLGGGIAGRVCSDRNFSITSSKKREARVAELQEALKEYFFNISNEEATEYDKWNHQEYAVNQTLPVSAY